MELPKNITQIGETNPHCKVYVEDYVISYIKQLNQYAGEKEMAVALYGIRKEEGGITYLFFYGACRLVFLQKECRHLSQAVLQEAEKQRKKFFPDTVFLGYRLLDGEMIEGFHICEQGVCRYVEGYAQFYEKNDAMLAFMLEERQEAVKPETVDQEKYNVVKRRQEERRGMAQEKSGHAMLRRITHTQESVHEAAGANSGVDARPGMGADVRTNAGVNAGGNGKLRGMKLTAAAVFALLCVTGLAAMGNGEKLEEWQMALRQLMENMSEQQLPDAVQVSNGTAQVGTIVAEDKLNNAILNENAAADPALTASGAGQASAPGTAEGDQAGQQEPGQGQAAGQEGAQGQDQEAGQEGTQGQNQAAGQEGAQGQAAGQEGAQGQNQTAGQAGTQGQNQTAGQEGAQGQNQAAGQEGAQGQDQEGAQGQNQTAGQEGAQGQDQAAGQAGAKGQNQAAGQEGTQGQDQAAGQQPVQSSGGEQDSGTSQTSGGGEQPVQGETQTPETKPAAGPTAELESYTIQRGDTLIGICVKRYGSDTRVSEVCSLNNIEDPDDIKVGEKIFLPQ